MSIGVTAIGEQPVAAQAAAPAPATGKNPKRTVTAKADTVERPEPR